MRRPTRRLFVGRQSPCDERSSSDSTDGGDSVGRSPGFGIALCDLWMSTEPISDRFRAGRPIRSTIVDDHEERSASVVRSRLSGSSRETLISRQRLSHLTECRRSTRRRVRRTRPLGREDEDLRPKERRRMDHLGHRNTTPPKRRLTNLHLTSITSCRHGVVEYLVSDNDDKFH